MIAAAEHTLLTGSDGSILLGAIAGVGALLFVFLLYLNKRWWWGTAVGAMGSCCDEACPPVGSRPVPPTPTLHYAHANGGLHHLHLQQVYAMHNGHQHGPLPPKNKFVKTYSFDGGGDSSSESELQHPLHQQQHQPCSSTLASSGSGCMVAPPLTNGALPNHGTPTNSAVYYPQVPYSKSQHTQHVTQHQQHNPHHQQQHHGHAAHPDLISLVERGRVGASSNSSCCSSTTSSVGDRTEANGEGVGSRSKRGSLVGQGGDEQPQRMSTCQVDHHRSPLLRETRIDNHDLHYQKNDPNLHMKLNENSNRDCIVVMNTDNHSSPGAPLNNQSHNYSIAQQQQQHHTSVTVGTAGGGLNEVPTAALSAATEDGNVVARCGHLEVALLYDAPMRKMTVHVLQARDIPTRERGQPTHTQVRLILLPSKKQKHKTKIRSGDNPQYMESFLLHRVNPEDVNSMGIRLRLYGCERMRRERLIGESIVSFANINLELENNFWLNLEPRANTTLGACTAELTSLARSDSTGSTHSMQHGGVPELLLGLCYNATTGRLNIEVVKGSHFRNLALNRAPDTYVKLHLVSSTGQELAQSKTTVRRGQPNPLFKETFQFQVALFQLADVTLMAAVYNRRGVTKRKEMVGWFSLGLNSSGAEELAHWMDMKECQQEQICRWHVLVQS